MDGSLKKIQLWDPVNEKWVNAIVDTDGYLRVNVGAVGLKASDLSINGNKYLNTNVKNFPANYPDSAVLSKLVDILTELEQKLEQANLHGYDGSAWQKLPLLFGYTDRYSEYVEVHLDPDDYYDISSTTPPAGYIYVVQSVSIYFTGESMSSLDIYGYNGSENFPLFSQSSPESYYKYLITGNWVLKPGDMIKGAFNNTVNGGWGILTLWGYKMKIA